MNAHIRDNFLALAGTTGHLVGPQTLDSGGLTVAAGGLGVGGAPAGNYGINVVTGSITAAGSLAAGLSIQAPVVSAANSDFLYGILVQPGINATSHTTVSAYGVYVAAVTPSNWGQSGTSGYGMKIVAPTGAAVDNISLWLSGTPSGGATRNLSLLTEAGVRLSNLGGFVASDHYLVIDTSGNLHVSALGPAS